MGWHRAGRKCRGSHQMGRAPLGTPLRAARGRDRRWMWLWRNHVFL